MAKVHPRTETGSLSCLHHRHYSELPPRLRLAVCVLRILDGFVVTSSLRCLDTFRDDRLHWNLDRTITTGGWFAGEALQFGGTGPWRKLLLYRE